MSLINAVNELVLEGVTDAESILKAIPKTHRQFERVYLRDELYDGAHPDAVEGLTVKPAVPDRVYRLHFPGKKLIGWADFRGKNGKLKIHRKGEWKEPRTSIPTGREAEMQALLKKLTRENEEEDAQTPIGEVAPRRKETVLVVVHPHSLYGSADFNIGPEQSSIARKAVMARIRRHKGPKVIVYDTDMEDDVDLSKLMDSMDKTYIGDNNVDGLRTAASQIMKEWPGQKFLVTGAWGDEDDGCTYDVAKHLGAPLAPEVPKAWEHEFDNDADPSVYEGEAIKSEEVATPKVKPRLKTVAMVEKAAAMLAKKKRPTQAAWDLLNDIDSAQLSSEDPEVKAAAKKAWDEQSDRFYQLPTETEQKLIKKLKSPMMPPKAPESHGYKVTWASGRASFMVRNKADAIRFIEKGGNDVVSASLVPKQKGDRVRNKL